MDSVALDAYRREIRIASDDLIASGYYERAFTREEQDGADPVSDKSGLSYLVVQIYRLKRLTELSRSCDLLLGTYQSEIGRLLDEVGPACRGFTWSFLPARTKVAAESACARLAELRASQYRLSAELLIGEMEALGTVEPNLAWMDFLADRDGYRKVLTECAREAGGNEQRAQIAIRLIEKADSACERIASLEADTETIRQEVVKAAKAMVSAQAVQMLDETPIEDITRQKQGIRAKVLRDCGYETIGKLRGLSSEHLARTTGIGRRAAGDVVDAVKSLENIAAKSVRIKLSADSRTPEANRLVCAVFDALEAQRMYGIASGRERIIGTQLKERADALRKHCSYSIWPFQDDDDRGESIEAFRSVNELLSSEDVEMMLQASDELSSIRSTRESSASKAKRAWGAFGENPIRFFGLIEELVPNVLGSDVDYLSGLPKRIVEGVSVEEPVMVGLRCELRRYQEWGVKYILHQGRVLLGDEMGLGKTIEAIASIVALKATGATHFLVICPAGVLPN